MNMSRTLLALILVVPAVSVGLLWWIYHKVPPDEDSHFHDEEGGQH